MKKLILIIGCFLFLLTGCSTKKDLEIVEYTFGQESYLEDLIEEVRETDNLQGYKKIEVNKIFKFNEMNFNEVYRLEKNDYQVTKICISSNRNDDSILELSLVNLFEQEGIDFIQPPHVFLSKKDTECIFIGKYTM